MSKNIETKWMDCGRGTLLHPNPELSSRTVNTDMVELEGFGRIFEVYHYGNDPVGTQRLILAAPELLAALEKILAYEDDQPSGGTFGAEVYAEARAAIAKVKA